MRAEQFQDLRQKHGIPDAYSAGWKGPDGAVNFNFCDSTITVHIDGSATETHMGIGCDSHEFITTTWRGGEETRR